MRAGPWVIFLACASLVFPARAEKPKEGWTVPSALKQIDRAMKDLRGFTAEVTWDELFDTEHVEGAGQVWVSLDGRFRGEVAGENPRTVLVLPPTIYIYRPVRKRVELASTVLNPDRLVQYALVGFVPAGSALKKQYEVSLIREDDLEGRKALLFTLVPKSEHVRAAVPTVMLWVDTTTWLPVQQRIRHQAGGLQVTVRYERLTPQNDIPEERFEPNWPPGTELVR